MRLRTEDLSWREVDGEIVILDLRSSTYFTINSSGTDLWKALADGASADELVAMMRESYSIDEAVARGDVDRFVSDLADHGLVER